MRVLTSPDGVFWGARDGVDEDLLLVKVDKCVRQVFGRVSSVAGRDCIDATGSGLGTTARIGADEAALGKGGAGSLRACDRKASTIRDGGAVTRLESGFGTGGEREATSLMQGYDQDTGSEQLSCLGGDGLGGGCGWQVSMVDYQRDGVVNAPMPFVSAGAVVEAERGLGVDFGGCSGVMVEVEEERLKVLASGARCVSLSSGRLSAIEYGRYTIAAGGA